MQLVVLAAGHGRRFGGLKQLAPVGPNGEAIMDYTARDAFEAGFGDMVLIVREEVRDEVCAHVDKYWPSELGLEVVVQGPVAGTAQAVASAAPAIEASFGVVNADDLYGTDAMSMLAGTVSELSGNRHAIVGYQLARTVLTEAPVTRGVCETTSDGDLVRIVEQTVLRRSDGFEGAPIGAPESLPATALTGEEIVSMNLWGFSSSIFDELEGALDRFDPETAPHLPGKPAELLLPAVVAGLVDEARASVLVSETDARCIGITHPDDLALVRELVASERHLTGS